MNPDDQWFEDMVDKNEEPPPQEHRQDIGCGLIIGIFLVAIPIINWVVFPILQRFGGKAAPYVIVAGCCVVLLWGEFRHWRGRRRRSSDRER